jgi:flagellar biosynthetic protein FlhB
VAEDSDLEKTEEPSPTRLEKAREDGDVPRSRELVTCALLLAAATGFVAFGELISANLMRMLSASLNFSRDHAYIDTLPLESMQSDISDLLLTCLPFIALLIVVAISSPILIGGWSLTFKAITPNLARFNPLTGLGNMFSVNALVELLKAVGKTILVGTVSFIVILNIFPTLLTLSSLTVERGISSTNHYLLLAFFWAVGSLVLIALVDIPYQLFAYNKKLRMTKEEVKQEAKEANGNPEIKARLRQQQREMARRRMMSAIPAADVVITNPTHYAVAIQYTEGNMQAPKVVAKGLDEIAFKIRDVAKQYKVLVIESPKLARALYANTEVSDEIPHQLYTAVAEILAYVFQIRNFRADSGPYPKEPTDIFVPDALDPIANTFAKVRAQ